MASERNNSTSTSEPPTKKRKACNSFPCVLTDPKILKDDMRVGLDDQRQTGLYCDTVLVSDGREFHCHRSILVSASPYFSTMFQSHFVGENEKMITVNSVSAPVLETILKYIYTGELHLNMDIFVDAAITSDQYVLPGASLLCMKYAKAVLESVLWLDHVFVIEEVSKLFEWTDIKSTISTFLNSNFEKILTAHFNSHVWKLSFKDFRNLIQHQDNHCDENKVFVAVRGWLNSDVSSRKKYKFSLYTLVRFSVMSTEQLQTAISCIEEDSQKDGTQNELKCMFISVLLGLKMCHKQLLHIVDNCKRIGGEAKLQNRPRCSSLETVLLAIHEHSLNMYCYIPRLGEWFLLAHVNVNEHKYLRCNKLIAVGKKVYFVFTYKDKTQEILKTHCEGLVEYDFEQNAWKEICAPEINGKQITKTWTFISIGNRLVAYGNSKVARYDCDKDEWHVVFSGNFGGSFFCPILEYAGDIIFSSTHAVNIDKGTSKYFMSTFERVTQIKKNTITKCSVGTSLGEVVKRTPTINLYVQNENQVQKLHLRVPHYSPNQRFGVVFSKQEHCCYTVDSIGSLMQLYSPGDVLQSPCQYLDHGMLPNGMNVSNTKLCVMPQTIK